MPRFLYRTLVLAFAFSGFCAAQLARADYAAQILSLNPEQYWRLNETSGSTAVNNVGSGVPGAYNNNTLGLPGPRPPAFPGFDTGNNAPQFNGVDSVVTTGRRLLDNQSTFTMLGWFKQTTNQSVSRVGLFGQNNVIEFGFIRPDTLQLWIETPFVGLDIPWDARLNNSWVFAAAVGDGTSIYVYLNGALAGSLVAPVGNYGSSAFTFNIGGNVFGEDGSSYNGQIDEVTVLNNRALTAEEIGAVYAAAFVVPEPKGLILFSFGAFACVLFAFRRQATGLRRTN